MSLHFSFRIKCILACACAALLLVGCATPAQTAGAIAGGAVGITVAGGYAPSQEIQQVYYLGVFDPEEQVPPTIYRLTVHGQASSISGMKFGSGWVPAGLIDSLNSQLSYDATDPQSSLRIDAGTNHMSQIKTGRRLIQFGPEGFREAPANHRLVVVMGSSPDKFFEAIDQTLGSLARVTNETGNAELREKLYKALIETQTEREKLLEIKADMNRRIRGEQ